MNKHVHDYRLAYTLKDKSGMTAVEMCTDCKKTKRSNTVPEIKKRASNMGGEFSTNWRP